MRNNGYVRDKTGFGTGFVFAAILFFAWAFRDTILGYIFESDADVSYTTSNTSPPVVRDVSQPLEANLPQPATEHTNVNEIGGDPSLHQQETQGFLDNSQDYVIFYNDLDGDAQFDPGEQLSNEQLDMFNGYWIPNNTGVDGYIMIWYTGNPHGLYVKDSNGWSYPISQEQARSPYITNIYGARDGGIVFEVQKKQ